MLCTMNCYVVQRLVAIINACVFRKKLLRKDSNKLMFFVFIYLLSQVTEVRKFVEIGKEEIKYLPLKFREASDSG